MREQVRLAAGRGRRRAAPAAQRIGAQGGGLFLGPGGSAVISRPGVGPFYSWLGSSSSELSDFPTPRGYERAVHPPFNFKKIILGCVNSGGEPRGDGRSIIQPRDGR